MIKNNYFLLFLLFLSACSLENDKVFKKLNIEKAGINFSNRLKETDDLNILDYLYFYNGGGVSVGDINNDGLPDIYLSANQTKNKLYLNKGGLKFEDISKTSGTEGNSSWNTGAVMGDVNGDGLLDIYVCAVVGLNGFNGHNELFINNGNGSFSEEAMKYGLDFESYSSNAAFLDYDLDGDLDIYLLNHAVHTQNNFGNVNLRKERTYETGDKLLRNDGHTFTDVSNEAGIFGGINGYGLGIAISDFNNDGFPDIYIGNDFHEDDYYYTNNGDGTFKEDLRNHFGHTSRFSMGSDVADINHDGLPDLISLDMLPEDEKILKSSEGDDNIQVQKLRIKDYGYHYQFTRNMLYINQPNGQYLETALSSGIAATDWSWSALFGDYDQDGEQDIFVSTGIPKRPNDLDYINFLSNENIEKKINNTNLVDQKALDLMPKGYTENKIFQGTGNLTFVDQSNQWMPQDTLISGATAYGDLDNDGDLDIVTNNLNHPVTIYENKTDQKSNYLKLKFNYTEKNKFGVGTKAIAYKNGKLQYKELYNVRGFQASSELIIHFGFGEAEIVDSLKIIWPDKTYQVLKKVKTNQSLTIKPVQTKKLKMPAQNMINAKLFSLAKNNLGINYTHKEDNYTDFNRQKLIPYQISDRGPATSIGDLNNDGLEDIFFGGSKREPAQIFIQTDSSFAPLKNSIIFQDSIQEDISSAIFKSKEKESNYLVVGTGGADFYGTASAQLNKLYELKQSAASDKRDLLPKDYQNTSIVLPLDINLDGHLDLYIGNQSISNDFGQLPDSHLLLYKDGKFNNTQQETFQELGMVTDAIAEDYNNDGRTDLIIVGEWMSPLFFKNVEGKLKLDQSAITKELGGLWQAIESFDIDNDGDQDFILGNWGSNSKFHASTEHPLRMYYNDFDGNGATETIVCIFKEDNYYPIEGLNGLANQMVSLRKKFKSYSSFAGKTINQIIDSKTLSNSKVLDVHNLQSGYLENKNGKFEFVAFPIELQLSPILDFLKYDFDGDGNAEILAGGNYFGVKPYHGRFDSFPGALIKSKNQILLGNEVGLDFMFKSIRQLNILNYKDKPYLLATFNNDRAQLYNIGKTE